MDADLSDFVDVQTLIALTGPPAPEFNRGAVWCATAWTSDELTRLYTSPNALAADYSTTHPAYIWGNQYFTQALRPSVFEVHRATDPPALIYDISVALVRNATVYACDVSGQDCAMAASDADATNDEIVTALAAVIDGKAISGLTVTTPGSSGSKTIRLTWTAGTFGWASLITSTGLDYGPASKGLLALSALTVEPSTSIAAQYALILAERRTAYDLMLPYPGLALQTAWAAMVEAQKKFTVMVDPSTAAATHVLSGATDLAAALKSLARTRSMVAYHDRPYQALDAAWSGLQLPTQPGTENWAYATLGGCNSTKVGGNDTQRQNILDKNGNLYRATTGGDLMWRGTMATGLKAGLRRLVDYTESEVQRSVFRSLKGASPYTVGMSKEGLQVIGGAICEPFELMLKMKRRPIQAYSVGVADLSGILPADKLINNATGFTYSMLPEGNIDTVKPILGLVL